MSDSRFETVRAKYRNQWDTYQVIARKNRRLVQEGKKPSKADLASEESAAAATELARSELLEALSRDN